MTEAVLDASALIAFLRQEPGAEKVAAVIGRGCISAVNLAETVGKLVEYGKPLEEITYQIDRLRIPVVPFEAEHTYVAASLLPSTRSLGLSLGDRACLALALLRKSQALTADREWLKADAGVKVKAIR